MRVAAAQTHPAWGDKEAGTKRVLEWIGRAADERVQLVAFGEAFLSGYPFWVSRTDGARFDAADQKEAYAFYLEAAVELGGPELAQISEAVRDLGVFTYLGLTERGAGPARGTVYCTLVAIDPARGVVSAHRKLTPTYEERLVWGAGDGHGLRTHDVGPSRVGGLNCWENWVPQARHAMYAQGEDLHVAVWPGSTGLTRDATRFVALEGRCFVLSAGALLSPGDVSDEFPLRGPALDRAPEVMYDGGSGVAGPDGAWVAEPVSGEERLVVADLDMSRVREERQSFDPTGHYARPDVFEVRVHRRRLDAVTFDEDEGRSSGGP
ncbi:MAG TPA: carbon-nitrogen hydrolase family protein [Actinomycetota bacterium]